MYCSEASPGSDSGLSEDPGHPDSPLAPKPPGSPAFYEVVYEAGALEKMQGEAGTAVELISIQLGQCSLWEGDIGPNCRVKGFSPTCSTTQALWPSGGYHTAVAPTGLPALQLLFS